MCTPLHIFNVEVYESDGLWTKLTKSLILLTVQRISF